MQLIRKLVLGAASLAILGAASAASAETRWDREHPRQHEVLARTHHEEQRIRVAEREGLIGRREARHLIVRDHVIAREDHALARRNGGYITPGQQRGLNAQENRVNGQIG